MSDVDDPVPEKRPRNPSARQKQLNDQKRDAALASLQWEQKILEKWKKEILRQDEESHGESSPESQDEEDQGYRKQAGGGFTSGAVIQSKGVVHTFTQSASRSSKKRKLVREDVYQSSPVAPGVRQPLISVSTNVRRAMSSPGPQLESRYQNSPVRDVADEDTDNHNFHDDLLDFSDTPGHQPARATNNSESGPNPTIEPSSTNKSRHQLQPAPFRDGKSPGKNRKASDYEEGVEKMLLNAMHEYACLVLSHDAFPDDATKGKWARLVWKNACEEVETYYELSSRMARLYPQISDRDCWVCSLLKDACREHFKEHFKFKKGTSEESKVYNKNLRHTLLVDDLFHHKNREEGTGYAEGYIIADTLEMALFEDELSYGVKYHKYFSPISTNLLALVFALLEFLIDEWSTGVQRLNEWTELSPNVTKNIRTKLFKRLMTRAGAPNGPPNVAASMTTAMRAKVQQDLQGRTGETDSENDK
ncbi:hypothetical protein M378DRAFT_15456 [Amanita muscaria Koide BX008]|uniref:DUF6532 domain-containing protein n=1 Tax=Amanita muscaria (strain Koide BX008) TaxID=946122 RepID=A0A0C2SWR5_AMAMK|nr:hypothetical protein M378DRAFT_15456 [Amanita muscaria Koide BX008]